MIDKNPYIPVEDEKTYKKVLEILTNYEDGEKKVLLETLAKQAGIDLEHDSIDNALGITILHGDGFDGLLSNEEVLHGDVNDLAEELGLTWDHVNDNIIFGSICVCVEHIEGGFYDGGVTVYHLGELLRYYVLQSQVRKFDDVLSDLGISQKEFCLRTDMSEQGVCKWKKTKFPDWVWYALEGMRHESCYNCPDCKIRVWGEPRLKLFCSDCDQYLCETSQSEY